ncbi:MAG: helix-turn-helix domain-containing protein [Alistipes sp.]|nr:helix-turn-helix domain-containing protein [Alistipes sp.]
MNTPTEATVHSVTDFTLSELIARAGHTIPSSQEFIVAHSGAADMEAFHFPCRIDAFIIGIGTEGETRVSINLNDYVLHENTLFLIAPQNIIQATHGTFKGHMVVVSSQFLQRMNIDMKHLMPLMLRLGAHPCIDISAKERQELQHFISLMDHEIHASSSTFADHIISELFIATLYKIGDTVQHYLETHPETENRKPSRAENYFRRFLQELSKHYKTERSVGFYAEQLCITPKYLTTLVKEFSKRSVSEWIEIYVILEAKTLLKYSNLSIQEIAYTLNFPNQSFFGSYFKRNTGMSPSQYKASDSTGEGGGLCSDI